MEEKKEQQTVDRRKENMTKNALLKGKEPFPIQNENDPTRDIMALSVWMKYDSDLNYFCTLQFNYVKKMNVDFKCFYTLSHRTQKHGESCGIREVLDIKENQPKQPHLTQLD